MSLQWMGTSCEWAQLCTWMEGHGGSSMNHLTGVRPPQIPMIYPQQDRRAMRGGQMHTVCSQYTFSIFTCTCLCSEHTQTGSHEPTRRTRTCKYTQLSSVPPRSLVAQLLLFAYNQDKVPTKGNYPSSDVFASASLFKCALSWGEVTVSWEESKKGANAFCMVSIGWDAKKIWDNHF